MGRLAWFVLAYVAYPLLTAASAAALAGWRLAGAAAVAGALLAASVLAVAAFLGARARRVRAHPLSALLPAALAVGLSLWPRFGVGLAQQIGVVPAMMPGTGRASVYERSEKIGFLLLGVSCAFFITAWHLSGKAHRSAW